MPTIAVPADLPPTRLDVFLGIHTEGLSRRAAQQLVADGAVRVNGRRGIKAQLVGGGDTIEIADESLRPTGIAANPDLDVSVVYEDARIVAVDKPAGMPVHALDGEERNTVANFLVGRYPEMATSGPTPLEGGIVHRLDNGTSGLLLAARDAAAYAALRRQFDVRSVTKEYIALVHGIVREAGVVHTPIAHDRRRRDRMQVATMAAPGARRSETDYRPIQHNREHTLLAVRIRTGVRHQVRVHLASLGHPLVGDELYGAPRLHGVTHHLLHACYLEFEHPGRPLRMELRSALPSEFIAAMRQAGRSRFRRRH